MKARAPVRRALWLLLVAALAVSAVAWWLAWRARQEDAVLARALTGLVGPPPWPAPYYGRVEVKTDLHYPGADGKPQGFDVYAPDDYRRVPHPLMIWVHGGGWLEGDKDGWFIAGYAQRIAELGFVVLNINYRLNTAQSPAPFPAATDDVAAFTAYLTGNLAQYSGGAPAPAISIGGHSAGGHLALFQATEARSPVTFACAVGLAGVLDLRERQVGPGLRAMVESFAPSPQTQAAASPVTRLAHLRARHVFLAHADDDLVVPASESRAFARGMAAAQPGAGVVTLFPAGGGHLLMLAPTFPALQTFLDRRCR